MSEQISNNSEKIKKQEITIDQCIKKADSLISKNGQCLFIFDVKGSRKYSIEDRQLLQLQLKTASQEMNHLFNQYFPSHKLTTPYREEKGFFMLLGDGSCVGINNSQVIPKISQYLGEKIPQAKFAFNVARDCYDEISMKLLK